METQIGFAAKTDAARHIIEKAKASQVTTRQEHEAVGLLVQQIRSFEDALEDEYKSLPEVIAARRFQEIKCALAAELKETRVSTKKRLLEFEDRLEAERLKAEREAQEAARVLAETAAIEAAAEAESSGDKAQAEAILAEPITPAVVVVPQEKLKVKGHSRRKVFHAKLVDQSLVPDDYWMVNQDKAEAVIKAKKEEGPNVIPGFLAWFEWV